MPPNVLDAALRSARVAIPCLALVACGGGGGGGGDPGRGDVAAPEAALPTDPTASSSTDPITDPTVAGSAASDARCVPAALPPRRDEPVSCAPLDDAARSELLALVNAARAEARSCGAEAFAAAPPLVWDPCLEAAAAGHSDDMATHDFFSHTGSDGSEIGARVTASGLVWSSVGENIAAGQATGADAMRGWIDSPGHCANLMDARFDRLGMACKADAGASFPTYWTQVFGRGLGAAPTP